MLRSTKITASETHALNLDEFDFSIVPGRAIFLLPKNIVDVRIASLCFYNTAEKKDILAACAEVHT